MAKTAISQKTAKTPAKKGDAPKKRKKNAETFHCYIHKVLKQVHPDTGISKKGMSIMNSFVNDIYGRIQAEADKLVKTSKRQVRTLSARDQRRKHEDQLPPRHSPPFPPTPLTRTLA